MGTHDHSADPKASMDPPDLPIARKCSYSLPLRLAAEGLQSVESRQKERAQLLYRPMSSPLRGTKSSKSRDLREKARLEKLAWERERKGDFQSADDSVSSLEAQAATALETDIDRLLEEEEELEPEEDNMAFYEDELEGYLAQEQCELEALIAGLDLGGEEGEQKNREE